MVNLMDAVLALFPDAIPRLDFSIGDDGNGQQITKWDSKKLGPQPTLDQLNAPEVIAAIAQAEADKQAAIDREAKIQAVMRSMAEAVVDGQTDFAAVAASASQAAVAVASPVVKVKP